MKIEQRIIQLQCDVCHKILESADNNCGNFLSVNHFCNYKCMDEHIEALNEIINRDNEYK